MEFEHTFDNELMLHNGTLKEVVRRFVSHTIDINIRVYESHPRRLYHNSVVLSERYDRHMICLFATYSQRILSCRRRQYVIHTPWGV